MADKAGTTSAAPSEREAIILAHNAIESLLAWDAQRNFIVPYKVRDPLHAALGALRLAIGVQPVAREPLSEEQIFDCANEALPGKGHRVISETDPEYAEAVGIEPGARWIATEVHPEHSVAFARAIERANGIT